MEALGFGRRCVSALCCLALLGAHASAFAQSTSDDLARRHFESGAAYLEESDCDNALADEKANSVAAATSNVAAATTALPAAPTAPAQTAAPSGAHASRLPAFIALGVGGVALGGAVITGIIANADYNDAKSSCSPACSDAQLSSGRGMALTSTILTGVAIVGVGVGVTLLFTSGPDPAQTSWLPRLHMAGAPGAARADASWRF